MSDIRETIKQMNDPEKSIGEILIEFYDTMKYLDRNEQDSVRGGKQATKIVMAINDISDIIKFGKNVEVFQLQQLGALKKDRNEIEAFLTKRGFQFVVTSGGYQFAESVTFHYKCDHSQQASIIIELMKMNK